MFWDILRKDLKRKKTMNAILFIFVVLSACFVAAGLSNVVSVMSGTDYYFDKAGLGDYIVVTLGEENIDAVSDRLEGESYVTAVRTELALTVDGDNISLPGKGGYETPDRMIMIQTIEDSAIDFFDNNSRAILSISRSETRYIPSRSRAMQKMRSWALILWEIRGSSLAAKTGRRSMRTKNIRLCIRSSSAMSIRLIPDS